jgi:hypothetical protein
MRRILRASKRLSTTLGTQVPGMSLEGLGAILQNATKPTAFKNLLRLRRWVNLLRSRGLFSKL